MVNNWVVLDYQSPLADPTVKTIQHLLGNNIALPVYSGDPASPAYIDFLDDAVLETLIPERCGLIYISPFHKPIHQELQKLQNILHTALQKKIAHFIYLGDLLYYDYSPPGTVVNEDSLSLLSGEFSTEARMSVLKELEVFRAAEEGLDTVILACGRLRELITLGEQRTDGHYADIPLLCHAISQIIEEKITGKYLLFNSVQKKSLNETLYPRVNLWQKLISNFTKQKRITPIIDNSKSQQLLKFNLNHHLDN